MADPLFDLERLRRNWTTPQGELEPARDRFEAVPSAIDVPAAARALLERLRLQANDAFPIEHVMLEAYLEQIELALNDALDAPSDAATERLMTMLLRFEELLEAFLVRLKA